MKRTAEPAAVLPCRTGDSGDDDDDDDDGSAGDVGFDAGSVAPAAEDWEIVTGSVTEERTCGAASRAVVEVGAADGVGAVEQAATTTSVTSAAAAEAVARADRLNRATGAGHAPAAAP